MIVYIVSSGEYSDYSIDRVFLDKEKAERYVKLSSGDYSYTRIEEYETDDDKIIDKITYIYASYRKGSSYEKDRLNVEFKITNTLDSTEDGCNTNWFYYYDYSGEMSLNIQRLIKGEYNENKIKQKYQKVCFDLMTKIEALMKTEGWSEKMVQEWFNQNVDAYLNKN